MNPSEHGLARKQPGATRFSLMFYEVWRRGLLLLLRLGFGLRDMDAHNVPSTGACILAANHQSYLDPPAIGGVLHQRNLDFIARAGLFSFRPLGWIIRNLNSIPVRGSGADAGTIREVVARLAMGRATLIFPEGSRTPDGQLQPFQAGVMLLVRKAKCPVVPVAIDGAFECWPRSRPLPLPWRTRVKIKYGKPIPAEELLALGTDAAMARIRSEIERLLSELRAR